MVYIHICMYVFICSDLCFYRGGHTWRCTPLLSLRVQSTLCQVDPYGLAIQSPSAPREKLNNVSGPHDQTKRITKYYH